MAILDHKLHDQTIGSILSRHDIPPATKRNQTTSWKDFICAHLQHLVETDFFTIEPLTLYESITYYVHLSIHPSFSCG